MAGAAIMASPIATAATAGRICRASEKGGRTIVCSLIDDVTISTQANDNFKPPDAFYDRHTRKFFL
ncbi:hypothetical protein K32_45950 [Kaistia sp. 32K]|nr:hypothetical protein K32_45950 [Kaistia sp. 32K]